MCQVAGMGSQKRASSVLSPALCLKPFFLEHLSIVTWTLCSKAEAGATRLSVFPNVILLNTSLLLQQMSYVHSLRSPRKASRETKSCRCLYVLQICLFSCPLDVFSQRRIKLKRQRNIPLLFEINIFFCSKTEPKRSE